MNYEPATLEPGYYWIDRKMFGSRWVPGHWDGEVWQIIGSHPAFDPEHVPAIGSRIEPPSDQSVLPQGNRTDLYSVEWATVEIQSWRGESFEVVRPARSLPPGCENVWRVFWIYTEDHEKAYVLQAKRVNQVTPEEAREAVDLGMFVGPGQA